MTELKYEDEQTFVMLKPDAIERRLVGEIIARLERTGLKLICLETKTLSIRIVRQHYAHLVLKPFFPELAAYITRGPVVTSIWEGLDAVNVVRRLVGATDPSLADVGTIRGDLGTNKTENLVHASDSPMAAKVEIGRFFDF